MPDFEEISLGRPVRGRKSAVVLGILIFLLFFFHYPGPATTAVDTAVSGSAVLLASRSLSDIDLTVPVRHPGGSDSRAMVQAPLPQGLVLPILASAFFQLFGQVGFRLLYAILAVLAALSFFVFILQLTQRRWIALLTAFFLTVNPLTLSLGGLDPNLLGLCLAIFLMVMIASGTVRPLASGLVAGAFALVQPWYLLFIPLLFLWVAWKSFLEPHRTDLHANWRRGILATAWFGVGILLVFLPGLYVMSLWHPGWHGLMPPAPFSPWTATSLWNYPFHPVLVRTPHVPYPALLMNPLLLLQGLGLVTVALAIWGLRPAWLERRQETFLHVSWGLIVAGFWGFAENWHEGRSAVLVLVLPGVFFLVATALKALSTVTGTRHLLPRIVLISLVLAGLTRLCFYLDFPMDPRWQPLVRTHQRQGVEAPKGRARELPEQYYRARRQLTALTLIPADLGLWNALPRESRAVAAELRLEGLPDNPWWNLSWSSSGTSVPLQPGNHHHTGQHTGDHPAGP
jgi:hypothetical protein